MGVERHESDVIGVEDGEFTTKSGICEDVSSIRITGQKVSETNGMNNPRDWVKIVMMSITTRRRRVQSSIQSWRVKLVNKSPTVEDGTRC